MSKYTVDHDNVLNWAKKYEGDPFHALICDPPYHLAEIARTFQGRGSSIDPRTGVERSNNRRMSRGFMGRDWDGVDENGMGISFETETWAAFGRLLHPGAFGMAFASTRGFHRMAVAIEDAGFIIHPMICWNFASGFPKATRISTQVDRAAGATPTVIGTRKHAPKWAAAELGYREKDNGYNSKTRESFDVTAPATPLAQAWEGHRYGLQSLKPAIEPIIVFQKPYQGRPVDSITRTGAGAINVDGGRIGTDEDTARTPSRGGDTPAKFGYCADGMAGGGHELGRWPSNLMLSHAPECNGHCVSSCPVRRLGEQSGELTSGGDNAKPRIFQGDNLVYGKSQGDDTGQHIGDSGTAARFFFNADYALDRLESSDPLIYVPKASTTEREAGLADFEATTVDDGREKSIDNPYQRGETTRRNIHPTIKPISLARHLATLLLPPDLYAPRRLLVPFAGAGSEVIGAMLAGWEDIQGIELEADHVAIARARIAFWQQMKYKLMNPDTPVKVQVSKVPDGQRDMFETEAP